ncbi:hypothetical protein [Serratia liquefaciens]|uniref:phage tail fiber protein n=1 Tax=Serratia liquefaciens TaxID=614 RepID=UPI0022B97BB7|nr:hypothetical protein [Serratia liquefaciens]
MAIYDTGTVTFNGTTVNGSGVNWQTANNPVRPGNTLLVMQANEAFTVVRINSATQLVVNRAPTKAISNSAYCLLLTDALSNDALAQRVSEMTRYYEQQVNAWGQLITASDDVSIVGPNGNTVKVPSLKKLYDGLGDKADKSDLSKKADTTALEDLSKSLGTAAKKNTGKEYGSIPLSGDGGFIAPGGDTRTKNTDINDLYNKFMGSGMVVYRNDVVVGGNWPHPVYSPSLFIPAGDTFAAISFPYDSRGGEIRVYAGKKAMDWNGKALHTRALWDSVNTSVDGNGFIKKASPIVKLFRDGSCELNEESQSVSTKRVSEGVYRVSGTLGFNADAGWGGQDGGIEVPLDRNKQPLIWVDYEVESTGDLLIKTFHRTHQAAPEFARNEMLGYGEGMPIDIPDGRWIDLRVQMPETPRSLSTEE